VIVYVTIDSMSETPTPSTPNHLQTSERVNLADAGIKGVSHYWVKRDEYNISEQELRDAGVEGNFATINREVVPALQAVNSELAQQGLGLIIKSGYRSPEEYRLIHKKRSEQFGKEQTELTLNIDTMPHADGNVVDVNLFDLETGEELPQWDSKDWPDGIFVDFYRDRSDPQSQVFQKNQDLLIDVMLRNGFMLGSKNEIWHFEFIANAA